MENKINVVITENEVVVTPQWLPQISIIKGEICFYPLKNDLIYNPRNYWNYYNLIKFAVEGDYKLL